MIGGCASLYGCLGKAAPAERFRALELAADDLSDKVAVVGTAKAGDETIPV